MPQHPSLPPTTLRHSRLSHWSRALESLCSYIANVRSRTDPAKEKENNQKAYHFLLNFQENLSPDLIHTPGSSVSKTEVPKGYTNKKRGKHHLKPGVR